MKTKTNQTGFFINNKSFSKLIPFVLASSVITLSACTKPAYKSTQTPQKKPCPMQSSVIKDESTTSSVANKSHTYSVSKNFSTIVNKQIPSKESLDIYSAMTNAIKHNLDFAELQNAAGLLLERSKNDQENLVNNNQTNDVSNVTNNTETDSHAPELNLTIKLSLSLTPPKKTASLKQPSDFKENDKPIANVAKTPQQSSSGAIKENTQKLSIKVAEKPKELSANAADKTQISSPKRNESKNTWKKKFKNKFKNQVNNAVSENAKTQNLKQNSTPNATATNASKRKKTIVKNKIKNMFSGIFGEKKTKKKKVAKNSIKKFLFGEKTEKNKKQLTKIKEQGKESIIAKGNNGTEISKFSPFKKDEKTTKFLPFK